MNGRTTMAARSPAVAGKGTWTAITALGGGAFAVGTAAFVVAGVLADLAEGFGTTVGTAGVSVTAYAIGYGVGSPLFGALLGATRTRLVLVSSLLLFGVFNLLTAVAPTFPVLVLARVLAALAAGAYVPAAGAAAAAMVPESQRGRALAVVLGGASSATVVGAPLGVVLAGATSWRVAFVLGAALAVVAAGVLAVGPLGAGSPGAVPMRERFRPLRSAPVGAALAVTALAMAGAYTAYTYLGPMADAAGWTGGVGLLIGVFGVGGVVGTSLGGVLVDRVGAARTTSTALVLLTGVFAAFPLLGTTTAGVLVFTLVLGMAGWACVPAQQHRLMRLHGSAPASVLALNSAAVSVGLAAGAWVGGLVVDGAGPGSLWVFATLCCAAGLTLHMRVSRTD